MFVHVVSGFDALGWASLVGSLLFLGGFLWLIIDNRQFERWKQPMEPDIGAAAPLEGPGVSPAPQGGPVEPHEPHKPHEPGRAA